MLKDGLDATNRDIVKLIVSGGIPIDASIRNVLCE